jgi:hypothetical protein
VSVKYQFCSLAEGQTAAAPSSAAPHIFSGRSSPTHHFVDADDELLFLSKGYANRYQNEKKTLFNVDSSSFCW